MGGICYVISRNSVSQPLFQLVEIRFGFFRSSQSLRLLDVNHGEQASHIQFALQGMNDAFSFTVVYGLHIITDHR